MDALVWLRKPTGFLGGMLGGFSREPFDLTQHIGHKNFGRSGIGATSFSGFTFSCTRGSCNFCCGWACQRSWWRHMTFRRALAVVCKTGHSCWCAWGNPARCRRCDADRRPLARKLPSGMSIWINPLSSNDQTLGVANFEIVFVIDQQVRMRSCLDIEPPAAPGSAFNDFLNGF